MVCRCRVCNGKWYRHRGYFRGGQRFLLHLGLRPGGRRSVDGFVMARMRFWDRVLALELSCASDADGERRAKERVSMALERVLSLADAKNARLAWPGLTDRKIFATRGNLLRWDQPESVRCSNSSVRFGWWACKTLCWLCFLSGSLLGLSLAGSLLVEHRLIHSLMLFLFFLLVMPVFLVGRHFGLSAERLAYPPKPEVPLFPDDLSVFLGCATGLPQSELPEVRAAAGA